jgi:hypothetical protein
MHISISASLCDVTWIPMEHHMNFYLYSPVRLILQITNHIFGLERKQVKEQVICRVELCNVLNVGVRIGLVMQKQPGQLPSHTQRQHIVLLSRYIVPRTTAHSTRCWTRIIKLKLICFALEQSFHTLPLSVGHASYLSGHVTTYP